VIPSVLETAIKERSPIILQVTEGTLTFCGYDNIRVLAGHLARVSPVPVVLLGPVAGKEENISESDSEAAFTDPDEAARFVAETGVDALAVPVGTVHGFYRWEPKLAHELLGRLQAAVPVPLVLHGGSGVPDGEIRKAVARGIHKVNVATEAKDAWAKALRQSLADQPDEYDPRPILTPVRIAVKEVVRAKIRLFGSNGRA